MRHAMEDPSTGSPADRLVYYTLVVRPEGRSAPTLAQLFRSLASLRAHNRAVPVRLCLSGVLAADDRARLDALDVEVEDHGDYEAHLRRFCPARVAEVVACLPFLHEVTSLAGLVEGGAARLLYLDVDTFFFGDVERLFDRYAALDLYAREEPFSRLSAIGHDPDVIDEAALAALCRREGARFVPPFNNGVMLMSRAFAAEIAARLGELLRDVFRFALGMISPELAPGGRAPVLTTPAAQGLAQGLPQGRRYADLRHLAAHRARLVTPGDEAEALPYPLQDHFLKDEVSLWLTVGRIPGARVGLFSPRDVMQGDEFRHERLLTRTTQTVAHYFSNNTQRFERWLAERLPARPAAAEAASTAGMHAFDELGEAVADAWAREDHDERAFPAIAAALLRDHDVPGRIDAEDVLRWLLGARALPRQDDLGAMFGDLPVTVYAAPRFYVQVIFWLDGSTALHRHAFGGAFQVLAGSSVHARYRFTRERRVNASLLVGDVHLEHASLLARGAVAAIEHDLIHSLFHLETPSATIVVRTRGDRDALPQYDYLPPHVAHDPAGADAPTVRREQALALLRRERRADWPAIAADVIARSDLHAGFRHLLGASRGRASAAEVASLVEALRARHGPVAGPIAASLREDARRRAVLRLRARLPADDADGRFFLALLASLPDRASILAAVAQRHPADPPERLVFAWIDALSGVDRLGVDLGDPLNRALVPLLLEGCTPEERRARLGHIFDPETVEAQATAIDRHVERVRSTLLAPLLRGA